MSDSPEGTPPAGKPPRGWLQRFKSLARFEASREFLVLTLITGFLLLYGLVPMFGGDQIGLVGADEPRYAQIAREMLETHSEICHRYHARMVPHSLRPADLEASYHCIVGGTVTPILYGKPWLEKPALYYWRAMSFFKEFGVSDWSARLPSTSATFALIFLIFLHMRRFRPGGHLDAALITASCVGVASFARGASTDMQLAAPFCIGMLGWYAWYETGKKFWLFDLYFFGAVATLAKGPVAPFLTFVIVLAFVGLRKEWSALRRTLWWPGILMYLVIVLPWYIAVQKKNPTFYRLFFLEHNLERFATNRYQHHQPIWYYLVVVLLGLMPWTVVAIRAMVDSIQISIAEWKVRHHPQRYLSHARAGDAFPEFLVLWALIPILFFSFSGSKLPGYILPAIPPITILAADYLFRIRSAGLPQWLQLAHAALCGLLVFVLVLAPQHMKYETLVPSTAWLLGAGAAAVAVAACVWLIIHRFGAQQLRAATLLPVIGCMIFLLGFHGRELDENYSARPLARQIAQEAPGVPRVAMLNVKRDIDYGMAFYRNQPMVHYGTDGVPPEEHLLVVPIRDTGSLNQWLAGRMYTPVFLNDTQGLAVYRVAARQ
ncbi:MAG: glycosyltransferase family 39 protein [Acidobacteriota bacterium]|nr:glycosyltransferase family 39 protein [Acidobacteriota bacterium]